MATIGWKRAAGQRRFLNFLGRHGDAVQAAAEAGVALAMVQQWRASDPAFARDWQLALRTSWEQVEAGVLKRLLDERADAGAMAKLLDSRAVLALMAQRLGGRQALAGAVEPVAGSGSADDVARARAEIAALGGS
jgi:hypothetical protein